MIEAYNYSSIGSTKFMGNIVKLLNVITGLPLKRLAKLMDVKIPSAVTGGEERLVDRLLLDLRNISPKNRYRTVIETKANGKKRICYEPMPSLKAVQRRMNEIIRKYPTNGVSSFSVQDIRNIVRTRKYEKVLAIDFKDFFPSITSDTVCKSISKLGGIDEQTIETLLMYGGILPQGAPTSSFVADLVMRDYDWYMRNYTRKFIMGSAFLRYADNVYVLLPTGTTDTQIKKCMGTSMHKLWEMKVEHNHRKSGVMQNNQAMEILGLTAVPVKPMVKEWLEIVDGKPVRRKKWQTYPTMRVSRRYIEGTFRELCTIYKTEKAGTRVMSGEYFSLLGRLSYIRTNNGRLKGCFVKVIQQLKEVSQNEHCATLHKLVIS